MKDVEIFFPFKPHRPPNRAKKEAFNLEKVWFRSKSPGIPIPGLSLFPLPF